MTTAPAFTLRPLERNPPNTPGNALEGAFRIHLSQKEQKNLGLSNGDLVRLSTAAGFKGYAVAWLASQTNPGNKPIAKVSDLLREHYDLALTDQVFIDKVADTLKPLHSVQVSFTDPTQTARFASKDELLHWIRSALVDVDVILPGCSFPVQVKGPKQQSIGPKIRAVVENIKPFPSDKNVHYFNPGTTQIVTRDDIIESRSSQPQVDIIQIDAAGIGGLDDQVEIINEELAFFSDAVLEPSESHLLGPTTFLLHGLEGTGKTLILERLAACSWQDVYTINPRTHPKGQPKALSEVFESAFENQPSLIVMDNLDKFLEKAEALVEQLRVELTKLQGSQVVVAAAARSIYDVDASLRTTSGFVTEIELNPPNAYQRADILKQIIGTNRSLGDIDAFSLAERLHGFVGRDIHKLCGLARKRRAKRFRISLPMEQRKSFGQLLKQQDFITQADFDAVIDQVQPTVLKGSILEVPKVKWTDIAGVDHVRELLEAITIRPFKYPELDEKFGGSQSLKGVLLYGPPGCAKTLIAQAVATESNQNFLAVKGSELIKMYVGESERAIRDVFRRARAAKPCIIFFDEIDSIGKSRGKTQDSGLNVVATLLNEMDGIEALKDVFVIGATNQPDILDSALIRTGRFDSHIHIGLPTEEARAQILRIHTRKRPLADDVDISMIATRTEGSSGADISGLCSMALELAIKDYERNPGNNPQICMRHFEQALAKHVPHTIKEEAERYKNWRPGVSLEHS